MGCRRIDAILVSRNGGRLPVPAIHTRKEYMASVGRHRKTTVGTPLCHVQTLIADSLEAFPLLFFELFHFFISQRLGKALRWPNSKAEINVKIA